MDRSSTDYFSFRFDPLVLILVRASSSIFLFPCTTRLSRVRSRDRSGVVVSDACVRFSPPFPLRSSSFYTSCARTLIPVSARLPLSSSCFLSFSHSLQLIVPVRHDCIETPWPILTEIDTQPEDIELWYPLVRAVVTSPALLERFIVSWVSDIVSVARVVFPGNNRTPTFVPPSSTFPS